MIFRVVNDGHHTFAAIKNDLRVPSNKLLCSVSAGTASVTNHGRAPRWRSFIRVRICPGPTEHAPDRMLPRQKNGNASRLAKEVGRYRTISNEY